MSVVDIKGTRMDHAEILAQIKSLETADIDADNVAEIFAHTVSAMSGYITEADLRRLILVGAAMYRNSTRTAGAELQIPTSDMPTTGTFIAGKDFLH
jgi:hypothetical protein